MPKVKAVSFDCAGTLLDVKWSPGPFALNCAEQIGLDLDGQVAQEVYERLLRTRWPNYIAANQTRSVDRCLDWWRDLTRDWLVQIGQDHSVTGRLMEASETLLYAQNGTYFAPFEDALDALQALKDAGVPMVVISNWDYSLHRVLRVQGLSDYFSHVFASLEEGVEKPDSRLFQIALNALGLEAPDVLHVGDHPGDDYAGATEAGLQALLIDREAPKSGGYVVRSLEEVIGFL